MSTSPRTASAERWFALRQGVPFGLFLLCALLTAAAAWYVHTSVEARQLASLRADTEKMRHEIDVGVNSAFDVVRATAALLTANNEMNGAEFGAYVAALHLGRQYPGLEGIGYARCVAAGDVPRFLHYMSLDGSPLTIHPAGPRPRYCPMMFLEPWRNAGAIGFDLATDPVARLALERASHTGEPVVSGTVEPGGPLQAAPGPTVLFVVPVYQRGQPLATIDERGRALLGVVLGPVRLDEVMHGIEITHRSAAFALYDGVRSRSTLRYAAGPDPGASVYESAERMDVAGQPWLVTIRLPYNRAAAAQASGATLAFGLVLALLILAVTRGQTRAWEITARHRSDLQFLALHDGLTGLPNRTLLEDRLAKAIAAAERHRTRLAVLFLDVDRFKQINDQWGHAVGDELLRSVAGRLTASVRRLDTVSRHGGDEFVLLLTDIDVPQHAADRAQEVIKAVRVPHRWRNHTLDVTVSVGVAMYPDDGQEPAVLLQAADAALYQAKERGRNTWHFFTPEMNQRAAARHRIDASLRRALQHRELLLHYQPTIALDTGVLTGVEALVRWRDPHRGLIGPDEFVPIAEESGQIVPLGRWALRSACAQGRRWCDAGMPLPVAVNVSAVELRESDFLDHLQRVLRETRLDPRYLELEITESVLMQQAPNTAAVLAALRALGVTIAIDDFGTGYSSLTYLRQFPVDVLKVDRSFVHEIGSRREGSPIVSAMISMARSLGHRVVAEGVETREQCAFLQAQHCEEGQGFYFSRPLPADEITTTLGAATPGIVRLA